MIKMTEQINKLNIAGILNPIKPKKTSGAKKTNRFGTRSFEIDSYIYENYPNSKEFVTSEMTKHFKDEKNWTSSDLSGQLYAKKNSGMLENRKPTDEEAKIVGKGVSIWHATEKFYGVMDEEMNAYSTRNLSELSPDTPKEEE